MASYESLGRTDSQLPIAGEAESAAGRRAFFERGPAMTLDGAIDEVLVEASFMGC
jgi:hypothetical protein